jgi:hypothetical protein
MAFKRKIDRNREFMVLHELCGWSYLRIAEIYGKLETEGKLERSAVQHAIDREKKNYPETYERISNIKNLLVHTKV